MDVKILKTFPYAADGTKTKDTVVDDVIDIRAELVPGLVAERYVREAVAGETSTTAVDIGDPETMGRAALIEAAVTLFRIEITNESDESLRRGLLYHLNRRIEFDGLAPEIDDDEPEDPPHVETVADPAPPGTAEGDQADAAADLWDVHYVSPHGEWFVDKGLTREAADARSAELQQGDEPSPSVRVDPHAAAGSVAALIPGEVVSVSGAAALPPADGGPAVLGISDPPVEIPDDWRDLHHATQISLAQKLNPADISTKAEAVAAIEAELAKRAV